MANEMKRAQIWNLQVNQFEHEIWAGINCRIVV